MDVSSLVANVFCAASRRREPVFAIGRGRLVVASPSPSSRRLARMDARERASMTTLPAAPTVRRLSTVTVPQMQALAEVLIDCVAGGASVSFMHPLSMARALAFWRQVADDVSTGGRAMLVAEDEAGIVGTVQLVLAQPENQPHRADVSKMLVHRRARRQGVGAALMQAAESVARACGKTLLTLDTASGDAERRYERLGWQRCGVIPGFALLPQGGLCATSYFYRPLDA